MRKMTFLAFTAFGALALVTGVCTPAAAAPENSHWQWWDAPGLDRLIGDTIDRNNELQSLQEQVQRLKSEIPLTGALEDPKLSLGVLNLPVDTFSFSQEPMTQKQVALSQKFPWFGKLDLKSRQAVLRALRQEAILETRRQEIARQVAGDYFELHFVDRSLDINRRLSEIIGQLVRGAETRYATGRGLQQDVLQAQVEMSRLMEEKIELKHIRRTLEDRINEMMNRETFGAVATGDADYTVAVLETEELLSTALEGNPMLKVRQADVDLANLDIELAEKDYWPDMDVRVAYGQREEDLNGRDLPDFFSAAITVNIPVWQKSRQGSKLAAARAGHRAALKSLRNVTSRLPHQLDALVTDINDIQSNYDLYTQALLPCATSLIMAQFQRKMG